jgi:sarcosine oxidase subunit gamma
VPSLIATPALQGLTPITHGTLTLAEATPARLTSVAPFRGQAEAVGRALDPLGLRFPAANAVIEGAGGRIVWTGPGQAFLLDADPAPLAGLAALTDQSDGWVGLRLSGAGCEEALARLIPLDLRPQVFGPGAAARAPLGHMLSVVMRRAEGIEILVFRSMARTAVHEITVAMAALAARQAG